MRRGALLGVSGAACVAGILLALAGCGGAGRGPAWPRSAGTVASEDWSEDGGESIAPHTTRAAAVEQSAEPVAETKVAEEPAARSNGDGGGSAATPEAPVASETLELSDEVLGEEIIIEIED